MSIRSLFLFLASAATLNAADAFPTTRQQDQKNDVKGQQQLNGSMGQIGTTYTLKNKLNLTILSARYTVEPMEGYGATIPETLEKLVVFELAVKNANPDDFFLNPDGWFTLVDDKGQQYPNGELTLDSNAAAGTSPNLKPGQGLGQPALKDSLHYSMRVPGNARITKLIFNAGRLNTSEDVMRYLFVEPPKDPAASKEKNFIAPLPDSVRDPSDPYGAIALEEGKAVLGQFYPSGKFQIKLTDVSTPAGAVYGGNPADDGKKYVVATIIGHFDLAREEGGFSLFGGSDNPIEIVDTDGERYKPTGIRKMKADEDPDHSFRKGDEYSFRVFFQLPKDSKPKHITIAVAGGRKWGIDLPTS